MIVEYNDRNIKEGDLCRKYSTGEVYEVMNTPTRFGNVVYLRRGEWDFDSMYGFVHAFEMINKDAGAGI